MPVVRMQACLSSDFLENFASTSEILNDSSYIYGRCHGFRRLGIRNTPADRKPDGTEDPGRTSRSGAVNHLLLNLLRSKEQL